MRSMFGIGQDTGEDSYETIALFESEEEAERVAEQLGSDYIVQEIPIYEPGRVPEHRSELRMYVNLYSDGAPTGPVQEHVGVSGEFFHPGEIYKPRSIGWWMSVSVKGPNDDTTRRFFEDQLAERKIWARENYKQWQEAIVETLCDERSQHGPQGLPR